MEQIKLQDVVRAVISLAMVGALVYLVITGKEISQQFQSVVMLVLGFWFAADRLADFAAKYYTSRKG